jgi:hypothetical protein
MHSTRGVAWGGRQQRSRGGKMNILNEKKNVIFSLKILKLLIQDKREFNK